MLFRNTVFAIALTLPTAASAQNLSIDDINKLIDEKVSNLNPYQAILNDPDPERALAGMQIMLEKGDDTLRRMAMEYGLLSPNATVQRIALEGFLNSNPVLSIRFDGTSLDDPSPFVRWIPNMWNGTVDTNNIGYWRIPVTGFDEKQKCYVTQNGCIVTVNSDGIFFTPQRMNGRGAVTESGSIEGAATLYGITQPVPFSIRLLD